MKGKILLFIPMYNCEKQIPRVINQLNGEICQYIDEMLIINNRSTDESETKAIETLDSRPFEFTTTVLRNCNNYGLGGSHKVAFKYALENGFDYIIVLHGDDQGSITNILPYLKNEEYQKYDCFLGARFMKDSQLQGYSTFRTFGNKVYNWLFSVGTHQKVYDLGSGLNMYSTKILKDQYYFRYADNLSFNYCMVLGSAYYKHKVQYFPILWREEDQVSNVKMTKQATFVLKLLMSYIVNKKKFMTSEHREKDIESYDAEIIHQNMGP